MNQFYPYYLGNLSIIPEKPEEKLNQMRESKAHLDILNNLKQLESSQVYQSVHIF